MHFAMPLAKFGAYRQKTLAACIASRIPSDDAAAGTVCGEFGLQPSTQGGIRLPDGICRHTPHVALRAPNQAQHAFCQIAFDRQDDTCYLNDAPHCHDTSGDHVPDNHRPHGCALNYTDGITSALEITGKETPSRSEIDCFRGS